MERAAPNIQPLVRAVEAFDLYAGQHGAVRAMKGKPYRDVASEFLAVMLQYGKVSPAAFDSFLAAARLLQRPSLVEKHEVVMMARGLICAMKNLVDKYLALLETS